MVKFLATAPDGTVFTRNSKSANYRYAVLAKMDQFDEPVSFRRPEDQVGKWSLQAMSSTQHGAMGAASVQRGYAGYSSVIVVEVVAA